MSDGFIPVRKDAPCPACGKPDWCARTAGGFLKCERCADPPAGYKLVKREGGGALFIVDDPKGRHRGNGHAKRAPAPERVFESAEAAIAAYGKGAPTVTYDYPGRGMVARWETPEGKEIRPVARTADGWIQGAMKAPRPLYRMADIRARAGEAAYVAEGEKCADALAQLGLLGTTSPHGAKAARHVDWTPLAGRNVVILPDADTPGHGYCDDVVAELAKLAPAPTVRVVELPSFGEGSDVYDLIEDRRTDGKDDAAIVAELQARAKVAVVVDRAPEKPADAKSSSAPILLNLADVQAVPLEWLWPDVIAVGKLTIISGEPGTGKSLATLSITAIVTTGRPWPDGRINRAAGGVVLLSAEDDPGDTIRPRLNAAGANVARVNLLTGIQSRDDDGPRVVPVTLQNIAAIERAIEQTPDCRLVIVDPISCYIGRGVDSHVMADVRALLTPLADLAARKRVAIVAVSHLRKGEGSAIHKTMGSMGFVAAARAVWGVAKDRENPLSPRRIMACVKNNLRGDGQALAFNVRKTEGEIAYIEWEPDRVTMTADEALAPIPQKRGPAANRRGEAVAWLAELLAGGPIAARDIKRQARECDLSWHTVRDAMEQLGIKPKREGFGKDGGWTWALPDAAGAP